MTQDEYVEGVLQKYATNKLAAQKAAESIAASIQAWAGSQLSKLSYSGSFAKETTNSLSTDVDLFISLKSSTKETLKEVYESLYKWARSNGWSPIRQNVSIGITLSGMKIDLVPGKKQTGYQNVHSLYKRKTGSWTQTNVKLHVDTVTSSGRTKEIRAIKIWRDLHGLSFPSFYLELMVIEGLKGRSISNLAANVLHALDYIGTNLATKRIVDPANTNNIISDDLSATEKGNVARKAKTSTAKQYWKEIIW
ncbi:hypothetical protein [Elongatibacter sediminis]|uniref:Nucleotidyltransferase n=1 Tax=Elongatibacter sediminis TaxID=3119006 RepID=A0AAW9RFF5_9GAMM